VRRNRAGKGRKRNLSQLAYESRERATGFACIGGSRRRAHSASGRSAAGTLPASGNYGNLGEPGVAPPPTRESAAQQPLTPDVATNRGRARPKTTAPKAPPADPNGPVGAAVSSLVRRIRSRHRKSLVAPAATAIRDWPAPFPSEHPKKYWPGTRRSFREMGLFFLFPKNYRGRTGGPISTGLAGKRRRNGRSKTHRANAIPSGCVADKRQRCKGPPPYRDCREPAHSRTPDARSQPKRPKSARRRNNPSKALKIGVTIRRTLPTPPPPPPTKRFLKDWGRQEEPDQEKSAAKPSARGESGWLTICCFCVPLLCFRSEGCRSEGPPI